MLTGTVAGNLGQDADLRYAQQSGDAVLNFSIASNDRDGKNGEKHTTWVRCCMFGKRAEAVHQYLRKGIYVVASGSMSMREFKGRDGDMKTSLEMRVSELAFHGGERGESQGGRSGGDDRGAPPAASGGAGHSRGGGGYSRGGAASQAAPAASDPPADDCGGGGGYGGGNDDDIPF